MAFLTEILFPEVPNQVGKLQKYQGVDGGGGGGGGMTSMRTYT